LTRVAGASISISSSGLAPISLQATSRNDGGFRFDGISAGSFSLSATDPVSGFQGQATGTLALDGETVSRNVILEGLGVLRVTVVEADGITPVPSARVVLTSKASFGNDRPRPFGDSYVAFTNGSGLVRIDRIAVGDFFVTAEAGPLAGVSAGSIAAPGATSPVTVQLGASGSIVGRVLLPDGMTAAAAAIVTLNFQSQSTLQSGVLQITTGLPGTFEFSGIPLGQFKVSTFELLSNGVRTVKGALDVDGQRIDLGDLVLDNTPPHVVSVDPLDRATGVPVDASITITFS